MPDEEHPVMTEKMIRSELGAILDELGRLPADAFADRSRLQARQADLRRLLREIEIPGAEDITKRWSTAAASKVSAEEPPETIVSPIEGGGGGGGF
jgi:hypothetical protein